MRSYNFFVFIALSLISATLTTASSIGVEQVATASEAKEKYCFTTVSGDGSTDYCYEDKKLCEFNFGEAIDQGLGNIGCTKN